MGETPLFSAMFSFVGMFYGFVVPLLVLVFLALVLVPSTLRGNANPRKVAEATFCYLLQSLGVLLMTAGSLPTVISVLAGIQLAGSTYFTLLTIFASGGGLFLWNDHIVRNIDEASREIPETLFLYLYRIIGHLIVFLWTLSFLITIISGTATEAGWWIMPFVMVCYGGLLVWTTHPINPIEHESFFSVMKWKTKATVKSKASKAPHPKKKVVRKKATTKRRK
ncbi:MAG: hypothetical protein O2904_04110 [bacterium]|nr:hypothetical protein [bacterium]